MNCNSCRYELSLCLDGRLPSGRRGIVMQHVEGCESCSTFWSELEAAQRLTLSLPREKVSDGFRDQLWERIRSGEGTPDAVFHEPVPLLAKARYALTGAAAAAAVLLCATWLRKDAPSADEGHPDKAHIAAIESGATSRIGPAIPVGPSIGGGGTTIATEDIRFEDSPLVSSARLLTTNVFALETARQLERRHASAHLALRRLDASPAAVANTAPAVEQLLTNATEFLTFGECLLDLHDRKQLHFAEAGVEADLRFAVRMIGQGSLRNSDGATVREIVGEALQSNRLGHVSNMIYLVALNPREEHEVLVRLNAQRPEVFPMLFFVFGTDAELRDTGLMPRGQAWMLDDPCGPSWVAPRSEVEARDMWLRSTRARASGPSRQVEVQLQIQKAR